MRKFAVFSLFIFLGLGLETAHAQIRPNIPAQPKLPSLMKNYWCAEVQDILFSKEPQQGEKLSVGVRVQLTCKKLIPGAPGQKLCDCAFEGPSGAADKVWSKTMSLRLIGIKYSETEANLLEYNGATPAFPSYEHSGFQVVGFTVTENDLKRGYIEVWGWASKEPLQCGDAAIYASFSVYNKEPYNQHTECHPHPDFKKSFKPKCLGVPGISEDKAKKGEVLHLPPEKFFMEKLPPIYFKPLDRSDFKIPAAQNKIELKNGNILTVEEFLSEVNALEKKLNDLGYTLRDEKPIKIKYIYPQEQFKLQKEMLSKDFLEKVPIPLPPQVICEGYSEGHDSSVGGPKDFVPLDWEKNWDVSFGNDHLGLNLAANMKINGEENSLAVAPLFDAEISLLGDRISVLKIFKRNGDNTLIGESNGRRFFAQPIYGAVEQTFVYDFPWEKNIEFGLFGDLFTIEATVGFNAHSTAHLKGQFDSGSSMEDLQIGAQAKAYGRANASAKIVSLGVDASLALIDNYYADIQGSVELSKSPNRNFVLSASIAHNGDILKGKLSICGEIDLRLWSKKFEVELVTYEGYSFGQTLFNYQGTIPAERDYHAYLKIDEIRGITPYTARNEKLDIEPMEYDLVVDIDGRAYTRALRDYNKDGIWGNSTGEYENQIFELPILSYKRVPISIEVIEKYKMGALEFKNTLDFAKGPWKKVELCYDPGERSFSGTQAGKEEEEIMSVGDASYWGEKNHGIKFKIGPLDFKAAPAKAK